MPWGDGFLRLQPAIALRADPDDYGVGLAGAYSRYFPDEIVDVVAASEARTVGAANAAVEAAGLLDDATAILEGHADLGAAVRTLEPQWDVLAHVADDGVDWEAVDAFRVPGTVHGNTFYVASRDHLYVLSDRPDSVAARGVVELSITADLEQWVTIDLPYSGDLADPDITWASLSLPRLAVGPEMALVSVSRGLHVDLLALVPDDRRGEADERNGGIDVVPDGLLLLPGASSASPEVLVPWSETGLDYEEYLEIGRQELGDLLWAVSPDGTVEQVELPPDACCEVTATSAGFLAHGTTPSGTSGLAFSADGSSWQPRELPASISGPSPMFWAVGDRVVVRYSGADGTRFWVGASDGSKWTSIDLSGVTGDPATLRDISFALQDGFSALYPLTAGFGDPLDGSPLRLIASWDGSDWLVIDLEAELANDFDFGFPAVNGDQVLVPMGREFVVVEPR